MKITLKGLILFGLGLLLYMISMAYYVTEHNTAERAKEMMFEECQKHDEFRIPGFIIRCLNDSAPEPAFKGMSKEFVKQYNLTV